MTRSRAASGECAAVSIELRRLSFDLGKCVDAENLR